MEDPLYCVYPISLTNPVQQPAHPAVWIMPVLPNGLAPGITGAVGVRNEPPDDLLEPTFSSYLSPPVLHVIARQISILFFRHDETYVFIFFLLEFVSPQKSCCT